jgi:signal transduction histidine kinase
MSRGSRRGWVAVAVGVALALVGLVLGVSAVSVSTAVEHHIVAAALVGLTYTALGGALVARLPRNRFGLIALALGLTSALDACVRGYAHFAIENDVTGAHLAAWMSTWSNIPSLVLLLTAFIAFFPDGRRAPRTTFVAVSATVAGVTKVVTAAVASAGHSSRALLGGTPATTTGPLSAIDGLGSLALLASAAVAVSVVVTRYRRGSSELRDQCRWFIGGGAATIVLIFLGPWTELLGVPLLPIAVAIAVFRRLEAQLALALAQTRRASELERDRIRRDLHDGLGPALTGVLLQLDAATMRAPQTDDAALLNKVRTDVRAALADVRRIIDALAPAAVDEHGLVPALRATLERFDHPAAHFRTELVVRGELPSLPQPVEVAAYRIATEAVTNTVRHADARHCRVVLDFDDGLVVEVTDDGCGIDTTDPVGVGLRSMRERARETGGTCAITPTETGGTRVVARLPVTR